MINAVNEQFSKFVSFAEERMAAGKKTAIASKGDIAVAGGTTLEERIDDIEIYDCLLEKADYVFTINALTPNFINKCKKHFKSYDEIDEIYEKLINIKL